MVAESKLNQEVGTYIWAPLSRNRVMKVVAADHNIRTAEVALRAAGAEGAEGAGGEEGVGLRGRPAESQQPTDRAPTAN